NFFSSNGVTFTVSPVAGNILSITSLSQNSAQQGSPGFTLFVFGSGFVPGATVQFGSNSLPTTLISSSELAANVPPFLLTTAGNVPVTVFEFNGTNFVSSNTVNFTVGPVSPGPLNIAAISPNSMAQGSPGFTLFVFGSGFLP